MCYEQYNWKLKVSILSSYYIKTKLSALKYQQRISTDKLAKSKFFWTLKPILHFILHSIQFHCSIWEAFKSSFFFFIIHVVASVYFLTHRIFNTIWLNTCPIDIYTTFKLNKRKKRKNTVSRGKKKIHVIIRYMYISIYKYESLSLVIVSL